MINTMDVVVKKAEALVKKPNDFLKKLGVILNKVIHIKVEGDELPVEYTLKEIGKDFLIVKYGESLRIIPAGKIIFVQIGDYPKEISDDGVQWEEKS